MQITDSDLPFEAGQAVLFVPGGPQSKPLNLIPGGVIKASATMITFRPLDGGRLRRVAAWRVAHAGYCAACQLPAHQDAEALICPRCEQPAEAVPPPDSWVGRHFPDQSAIIPRAARRAVLHPELSRRAICTLVRREDEARRRAWRTRLGVDSAEWWGFGDNHRPLERYAEVDDAAGFAQKIEQLRAARAETNSLIDFLVSLLGDDTALLTPPPAAPTMPADDRTPDGEDEFTIWLARQAERHARRKAA